MPGVLLLDELGTDGAQLDVHKLSTDSTALRVAGHAERSPLPVCPGSCHQPRRFCRRSSGRAHRPVEDARSLLGRCFEVIDVSPTQPPSAPGS